MRGVQLTLLACTTTRPKVTNHCRSILARGLHALLPPLEVCQESFCNADPDDPRQWEPTLRAKLAGRQPRRIVRRAPFVQVCLAGCLLPLS